MAVYQEVFPATDWDREGADGSRDTEYYRPRIVALDGKEFSTGQYALDLVAAGKARFEYRPEPRPYHPNGIAYLVTHEGATLADREQNWSDDSDWYAIAWDGEKMTDVGYRTTRGGGTDDNYVKIDPTPEVLEAVRAYQAERNYASLRANEKMAWLEDINEAASVELKGQRVRVAKGRKVPLGTEGTVFWAGEDRYSGSRWSSPARRIGFKADDGTSYFTAATNLIAILGPDDDLPALADYVKPEAEVRERARTNAEATWTDRGARLGVRVLS